MGNRNREQGFTLIEAAVAIAVVAILSGIIVPLVVKNLRDSQRARALNDVQVIAAAVASQIKDTGRRPAGAGGPNACSGAGNGAWYSGAAPVAGGGAASLTPINVGLVGTANNTFANLFSVTAAAVAGDPAQVLFYGVAGAATITTASEFAYKGPYLAPDVSAKLDPWGRRYVITGYNATQNTANGPIFVFSAGPDNTVLATNWNGGVGPAGGTWATTTTSADDITVRVN
jgi:prepilin-type N-terminal cleavage/methylation domain-containing protein